MKHCHTLLAALLIVPLAAPHAAEIHVAPNGNDANPGTKEEPFATLERARDEVRAMRVKTTDKEITVHVKGGVYRISRTLVFSMADSAGPDGRTVFQAAPGEKPVLSSGIPVTGWRLAKGPLDGLPDVAKGKVWEADIPAAKIGRFYTLYAGEKRLPRARSRGFLPVEEKPFIPLEEETLPGARRGKDKPTESDKRTLRFPPGTLKNWANLQDVEILILPARPYYYNILGLKQVDEANGIAITTVTGADSLTRAGHFADTIRESVWVENVLEALDAPGEWVSNSQKGKIYYWPEEGRPPENVVVPGLIEYVRFEGDEAAGKFVSNITLRGLSFMHGERWTLTEDSSATHHEEELYDSPTALVRLRGAEKIRLEANRFAHTGGSAVRLDLHCQDNEIVGNLIEHVGGTGVFLGGYGPGGKNVSRRNQVVNNHIHHIGEIYRHAAAVYISHSSDNRIAHNNVHDVDYVAFMIRGTMWNHFQNSIPTRRSRHIVRENARLWLKKHPPELAEDKESLWQARYSDVLPYQHTENNVMEYNDISRVMKFFGDGNAVYMASIGRGNVLRNNYIHEMEGKGGQQAVRTDHWITGTLVEKNIICNVNGGGINLKYRDNHVRNNFVIGVNDIVDTDRNGKEVRLFFGYISLGQVFPKDKVPSGSLPCSVEKNIFYKTGEGQTFFRDQSRALTVEDQIKVTRVADCRMDSNLYYSVHPSMEDTAILHAMKEKGIDPDLVQADPLFMDVQGRDFSFQPGSPATSMGIEPIDVKEIGLSLKYPGWAW